MLMCILFLLETAFGWQSHLSAEQLKKAGILPWIGVLKVRSGNKEFATGLTLISQNLALANADDLSKLDKQTLSISTKAIFFKHNIPFYCDVKDVKIHPEYNNDTLLNTLSVINLDCGKKILWTPIILPIHKRFSKNIYAIGLNDRNYDFEQIVYRMKFINSTKCRDFYIKEEIDFKNLWPEHYICYKTVDIKRQCVFDSGMSLVSINKGNWTLIGISVLGPGCVLPSRYIDIFHYLPWMTKQINTYKLSYRRQHGNKGEGENKEESEKDKGNVTAIDPSKDIVSDVGIREDDFYVEKLNSTTMVLRPKYAHVREVVHGDCLNDDGVIMYRDAGIIRTSQKKPATGTYALSLYDLFFYDVKCVMVSVGCDKRTITKFWFDKGFKTDNMEELIKVVPQHKRGKGVPPKILYITDSFFNYEHIKTSNLVFKFEFTRQATINVDFYGSLATTTPTTTTTTTTRRSRGTHRHHLYQTRGYYIWEALRKNNIDHRRKKITRTRKRFNLRNRF